MKNDTHFRPALRHLLCKTVLLCAVLFSHSLHSAPLPVVFAIDAALNPDDWRAATEVTLETSSQLSDETAFSIVIFDDVVQRVVPLGTMGTERLALIKQTLDATVSMPTSNLAAGLERAQDELKDLAAGHIVLFTTAEITTQTDDNRAQYLDWYANILLPDAAEKALTLTFITQATTDTSQLLKAAQSYQNTSTIRLIPADVATDRLIASLQINSEQTQPSMATQNSDTPEDSVAQLNDGLVHQSTAATPDSAVPIVDNADNTQASPNTSNTSAPVADHRTDIPIKETTSNQLWDRQLLYFIWYGCLVLALLGLIAWLIWSIKKRKASQQSTAQSNTGQTGSAYLPLNEMPSRRFDALADAIDDLEPYKEWTAEPRTAKQVNAEQLARQRQASLEQTGQYQSQKEQANAGQNDAAPPRESTPQRIPNVFKPKK